jgi:15-cis-phytoene synthase
VLPLRLRPSLIPGVKRPVPAQAAIVSDAQLRHSLEQCRLLLGAKGKSFAFAARFLPPQARLATQALYAIFRTVDDVADGCRYPGDPTALARLDDWSRWVERGCPPEADDPVRYATSWAVARYDLDRRHLLELLAGVRGDVTFRPITTVEDQERYCYQVAATVGLTMARILGATGQETLQHAAELGIAMQLTNIVRDVGEDIRRGRIYLPLEELRAFGCTQEHLSTRRVDTAFVALLQCQIARARAYYRRGNAGIAALPADAQFAIRLAAHLYAGILDKVEQQHYDVFTRRAHLSRREKLWLTFRVRGEQYR